MVAFIWELYEYTRVQFDLAQQVSVTQTLCSWSIALDHEKTQFDYRYPKTAALVSGIGLIVNSIRTRDLSQIRDVIGCFCARAQNNACTATSRFLFDDETVTKGDLTKDFLLNRVEHVFHTPKEQLLTWGKDVKCGVHNRMNNVKSRVNHVKQRVEFVVDEGVTEVRTSIFGFRNFLWSIKDSVCPRRAGSKSLLTRFLTALNNSLEPQNPNRDDDDIEDETLAADQLTKSTKFGYDPSNPMHTVKLRPQQRPEGAPSPSSGTWLDRQTGFRSDHSISAVSSPVSARSRITTPPSSAVFLDLPLSSATATYSDEDVTLIRTCVAVLEHLSCLAHPSTPPHMQTVFDSPVVPGVSIAIYCQRIVKLKKK